MHRGSSPVTPLDTSLIESLMSPAAFSHPVGATELIETHISWVILTDDYVYKIKKPIVLDFLDFHDLKQRKFYCEEEIRLNQPWAPDIYLDVVPITIVDDHPRFNGDGTAIEYAVRMRRFDAGLRLDTQLERGLLSVADMKELGRNIAARHTAAPAVDANQRDRVVSLTKSFIRDNFAALDGFIDSTELDKLRRWTEAELQTLEPELWRRFDDGYVRDCHGDLHLANLVRLADGITTFDCIEFNADLRQIDVICDIAFLIMDLVARARHDLAAQFLNRYLERTGDYAGLRFLSLYFVYRCLVRAKVAVILSKERDSEDARKSDLDEAHRYCAMATRQIERRTPILIVVSGLSGSGKTWVSGQLISAMPVIRIRSDLERKRIFGLGESESSASDIAAGIYTDEASQLVYRRLFDTAQLILEAGHNVMVDAAFLKEADRAAAISLARDAGLPRVLLQVNAETDVMRDRIRQRLMRKTDASEAGLDVLEHQLATAEPLTDAEQEIAITCDNSGEIDIDEIAKKIKRARKAAES
jgi:aminoglycoside phosphotransferase family enzyme/adenylate kinase family enzyme